ncbi:hypothetical protein [Radiobacillus sp. PE A8.2]|uniref:hypothetical protein n=1 Tax=Radiobacillus sp. PE A8.2 TaxID=3380349 RepID=UPI00388DDB93
MIKKILILVALIFVLVACGGNKDDFKGSTWGMTVDQIIELEKENGNELYTEDVDSDEEITIQYEDIIINGHKADVEYVFKNEVEKTLVLSPSDFDDKFRGYNEKLNDESLSEEEKNDVIAKFEEDNKELIQEYENIPDILKLNDFALSEGIYWFSDLDEEDEKYLYESLVSNYGDPSYGKTPYDSEEIYSWYTDRTTINFSSSFIFYYATYSALEDLMKLNNQNKGSSNDL